MTNSPPILAATAALAAVSPLAGQVEWNPAATLHANRPPERNVGTFDYIHSLDVSLLYTGWHPSLSLADLWQWDGQSWTQLDANVPAGVRWGHLTTYDLLRDRLVVFGGARGFYLSDTWELDCQTMTWTQQSPSNSPSARAHVSFAYDLGRGVTVMFGGHRSSTLFDETWEWDGTDWTLQNLSVRPPARRSHAMAYDLGRQRIVMFGGIDNASTTLGDTWEYDGTAWSQQSPAVSPSARGVHAMTYDNLRGRVVMHGGNTQPWNPAGVGTDETWEWDGTNWLQRSTSLDPANSWQRCMTYDGVSGQVLLFGGSASRDELWIYEPTHHAAVHLFGSGCPGSAGLPWLQNAGPQPWLGETVALAVTPTPATGAILVVGLDTTAPVSLQSFGLTGCFSHVTYDASLFASTTSNIVHWSLALPNQPTLLGAQLHNQAVVLDGGAAGGAAVSNALTLTLGGL